MTDDNLATKAPTPIPTMLLTGRGYEDIIVAKDGIPLAKFERRQSLEAHGCQFGALYIFGISYETKYDGNSTSTGIKNFFDLLSW